MECHDSVKEDHVCRGNIGRVLQARAGDKVVVGYVDRDAALQVL